MSTLPAGAGLKGVHMLNRLCAALLAAALLFAPTDASAKRSKTVTQAPVTTGSLQLYATESAAQAHCPRDVVVWLNTNSGIYHEKGMRWYGNTKSGAYVCRREADAAGDRDTRNGQ
jgi:hypothetical protein